MPRRTRRLVHLAAAVAAAVGLGACQDYNFSPVRYSLIQPGTEQVTLSNISTADILFVVDDSGSMGGEQTKLAESFDAFVRSLKGSNQARVDAHLEPIDFHIAITTTSVFLNAQTSATCSTGCAGALGSQVCCDSVTQLPLQVAKACATSADCAASSTCSTECLGHSGEKTCCTGPNAPPEQVAMACSQTGAACGRVLDRYVQTRTAKLCAGPADATSCASPNTCKNTCTGLGGIYACCDATGLTQRVDTCDMGVGVDGGLYPRGNFVRKGSNPLVLHFDKSLFCSVPTGGTACSCTYPGAPTTCATQVQNDAAVATLVGQFKQNIAVGTCGSGQEQGLEAARRAIQKALGQDGQAQPLEADGSVPAWPHPRKVVAPPETPTSKLVVVFVGDEDDCSSPEDPTKGVIFTSSGTDACEADGALPADQQRRYPVQDYVDYLTSLGRPVAGSFIVSATGPSCASPSQCQALCGANTCPENCVDADCQASICCDTQCTGNANVCTQAGLCGGQGAGYRFVSMSGLLGGRGADIVVGSVCNPGEGPVVPATLPPTYAKPGFSSILERVAEVVKQPVGMQLPTQPASASLALLRIVGTNGKTRRTCIGPAPAASPPPTDAAAIDAAVAAAELSGAEWWFTGGDDTNRSPTGPSRFIYLNRTTRACEANPGETYSADYLGLVPASGCDKDDPALGQIECQAALGRQIADWRCDGSGGGLRGTCVNAPTIP